MRRRLLGLPVALLLSAITAGTVLAASATIQESSQSHGHGVAATWHLSWGTHSPYHVEFYYGDGLVTVWENTTLTSAVKTHAFYPCTTTVFHQELDVWDGWNDVDHTFRGTASDTSTATESGGTPC
jgi:hypothetical protein